MKLHPLAAAIAISFAASHGLAAPITLQGNYIKIGTNDLSGALGSGGSAPPGILFDGTGQGNFNPAYDYLTPGTAFEGYGISSNLGDQKRNNAIGMFNTTTNWVTDSFTDYSGVAQGGFTYDKRVIWQGTYNDGGNGYTLNRDIAFNNNDKRITIRTTITAISNLTNLKFAEFTDPDVQATGGDSSAGNNSLGAGSIPASDLALASATASGYTIGLYSNSAVTHHAGIDTPLWSTLPADYLAGNDDGATPSDSAIGMGFNIGTLNSGDSITLLYYYVFGTDLADLLNQTGVVIDTGSTYVDTAAPTGLAPLASYLDQHDDTGKRSELADELNEMSEQGVEDALKSVLPTNATVAAEVANSGLGTSIDMLHERAGTVLGSLNTVRDFLAQGRDDREAAFTLPEAQGSQLDDLARGLAATPYQRFQTGQQAMWVQGVGGQTNGDKSDLTHGYDADHYGVVMGYEYSLNESAFLGLMYGGIQSAVEYGQNSGDTEVFSHHLGLYGQYLLGSYKLTALLSYGMSDYDNTRKINVGNVSGKATADYDGDSQSVSIGLSRLFTHAEWEIEPFAVLAYTASTTDSYTEAGTEGLTMAVGGDTLEIASLRLGSGFKRDVQLGAVDGTVTLKPSFRHQEGLNETANDVRFVDVSPTTTVRGDDLTRDSVGMAFELGAHISESGTLKAGYDLDLSEDQSSNNVYVGYQYSF